jgi:hypothetical protein
MQKSESIKDLAVALAKAQAEIMGAHKDSANPYFNSRYADLASVWDACRDPLSKNGLSIVQTCGIENGMVSVETMLLHKSGQYISDVLQMKPVREKKGEGFVPADDPQAIGSCITYARRYSVAAMAGVCPEDDDGNVASGRGASSSPAMNRKPPRDPSAGFDPTWREVTIHFGTHKDKKLGELEAKSIHWYYAEWMPKKKVDAKFPPKGPDKLLFAALESWHAEVEAQKASAGTTAPKVNDESKAKEPPVVEIADWRKIKCHVGKINGEVHGKLLGDLYPANLDKLKENFKPVPSKDGTFDPVDATLFWAIRAATAEMDAIPMGDEKGGAE